MWFTQRKDSLSSRRRDPPVAPIANSYVLWEYQSPLQHLAFGQSKSERVLPATAVAYLQHSSTLTYRRQVKVLSGGKITASRPKLA